MIGVACLGKGVWSWSGVSRGGGPGSCVSLGHCLSWERDGAVAAASGSAESWDAPWSSGPGSLPCACAARALEVRARPCCAPQPFQAPGRPLQSCPAFPLPEALLEVAPEPFLEKGG